MAKEVLKSRPTNSQTTSNQTASSTRQSTVRALSQKGSHATRTPVKQTDPIGTAHVTVSALNVRDGAGQNYKRIGGLTEGKTVQVYEEKDGWLKINYGSGYGWIAKQYTDYKSPEPAVTETPAAPEQPSQPTTPEQPTTEKKYIVTTDALNLRDVPGNGGTPAAGSTVYLTIPEGTKLEVLGEQNGWYKVSYGGVTGWCCGQYTAAAPSETTQPGGQTQTPANDKKYVVTTDALNMRDVPGNGGTPAAGSTVYLTIPAGTKLEVLGEQNGWYKVSYGGKTGWCCAQFTAPYTAPSVASGAQQAAADYAHSFLGRTTKDLVGTLPYLQDLSCYGGTNNGYDNNCANFVSAILQNYNLLNKHYINISGITSGMLSFGYQKVSRAQARPGDVWCSSGHTEIVYKNNSGKITLVGSNNGGDDVQEISEDSWSGNQSNSTFYQLP
ncbi:MAG: SH3 domain-containing protein [Proteobacteria bacterium]|nr:SH3 domain-containing protein [Pseudomonadota bacterium]